MGTRNYPWNFILSALLCTMMALEGRDARAASPESHVNVSWSTNNNNRTGPGADRNDSMAEPSTQTAHSLLGTSLPPFMMMMVDGEGRMNTSHTMPAWEGSTSGEPAEGSAFPTTGTTHGVGTESATTSSPPLSTATTSHSSSSSSSSSPKGSPAVTPIPEQSSTSSTTETPSATTSHPPTALVLSSHSVSAQFSAGTAMTQGPTTPRPVAATSVTSPASDTTEARLSPTLGSSTETWTAQPSSTPPTQGQPTVEVTATSSPSSPTGSPSPSTATASAGSSATIPAGDWESSTMNEGSGTTTDPSVGTSHSLPSTSLLFLSTTGMVRTGTTPGWGGSSLGTSPGSGAVSSAFPTTGTGTTIPSMDTGSGTAPSLAFSSATTSHSSSSSSSPGVSPAVTPSPQQSSTSSTTGMLFTTASHPSTALALSTAAVTGTESDTVTAEEVTPSPAPSTASTNPGASASTTSPASGTTESSRSPTLGSGTETPRDTSTPPTQGQPTVEVTPTSPPAGSPSPSTTTIPPGEGNSSTTNQGSRTTAEPIAKTSHSPPSTSVATPSTTNLSVSTSVNPSFTGACLSVSIEVQNVTGKEIHLSWTSGSKGSLYIISVMDGKETNKTATEDTKAVLKNLIPGHVYNISVAESSCAENNQASVTVRTDPDSCFERTEFCLAESTGCSDLRGIACSNNQAFFCSVSFKSQTFNNTLYNSHSEGYKTLSERIKTDIVEGMRAELGNDHFDIFVLGFRPGSVVADFLSLLPKEEAVDLDDIKTHLSTVLRNKFGDQAEATVQPLSAQSPTDNSSSWRVAVIVLGVLLGVALVLILLAVLFYIYARRRSGIYFE